VAEYKIHPIALTYPPMTEAELEALTVDIAARGLKRKIVLYEGQVLDGRCRLEACKRASVEPEFEEYAGDDPLSYANSLNLTRDMTAGQRAIVAARQWDGDSKGGRPAKNGKPSESTTVSGGSLRYLAKHFRNSDKSIRQAKELLAEAADLAEQVQACTLSLAAAYEQLQDRRNKAAQKARDAAKVAEFREAVSNGEMSQEEALQKAMEAARQEKEREEAEADARKRWLTQLGEFADWFDAAVVPYTDDELRVYVKPDGPGWIENGVTGERLASFVSHIERLSSVFSGETGKGNRPRGKR
jgi:hypothetical protein